MSQVTDVSRCTPGSDATRGRIVSAASEAFRAEGYNGASTRGIAAAAGVNPSLIFRYFGSKAGLYEVAVLHPLQRFIDDYLHHWDGYENQPHSGVRVASEYLGGLYDLFRGHRELVLTLVGESAGVERFGGERAQVASWVAQLLDGVQVVVDTEAARRGWSGFDGGRMSLRMALGLAFSMAVLHDWMFPDDGQRPSRDQIVASMVSYVLRSMSNPGGVNGITDRIDVGAVAEFRR
jgi:AcrR family transcriptional regulator